MPYKDPAARKAYHATWRATHREQVKASHAAYRATYHDQIRIASVSYQATYIVKNREKRRASSAAYDKTHPEKKRVNAALRRARKRGAPVNDFTSVQWVAVQQAFGYRCVYCGIKPKQLTMDHITPLSKGGSHTLSNIVPACRPCNSKKHAGPVLVSVQPLLLC